jgi:hypothetical protein
MRTSAGGAQQAMHLCGRETERPTLADDTNRLDV